MIREFARRGMPARLLLSIGFVFWTALSAAGSEPTARPIRVLHPRTLPADPVPAVRVRLGIPNDYKPFVTRLKSGHILAVAFCFGPIQGIDGYAERAVFWRSKDGGKTWGPREERLDIQGREFGLSTLADGTLLMTCHWLARDVFNPSKHTHSKVFRSTDEGKTWTETRIGPEGFPDRAETAADWMAFEVPDKRHPDKSVACLGVSMQSGGANAPRTVRIWRSTDSGKSWDRSLRPDTAGWIDVDGFFSQTVTFRTTSGRLLHPVRVDRTGPHWHIPGTPKKLDKESGDQGDRMMLWESMDDGRSWQKHRRHGNFGTYGEMYPRFLKLQDGRLLLTFTVRSNPTDGHGLGLRAITSGDDGRTWDFEHDRLVISDVNHGSSGGGFGNTIQTPDGALLTIYSYRGTENQTHIESVRWRIPTPTKKPATKKPATRNPPRTNRRPSAAAEPKDIRKARVCVTGADVNRPRAFAGSGDFIGWPGGVERMPNGDLLLVHSAGYWHSSFAEPRQIEPTLRRRWLASGWPLDFAAPTGGRTMACRSRDGGKTWSRPETLLDHPLDDGAHAVFTCRDGTVLCFVGVQASWYGYQKAPPAFEKDIDGLNTKQFVLRSTDSGRTWSKPIDLESPGSFYERAHGGRPIQLADGGILWATYYQAAGDKYLRGAIRRSDDSGKTWRVVSRIKRPDNNVDEPAIVQMKDGRLLLVTRPDGAVFDSRDNGVTWLDTKSRIVPAGSSKFKAPQLIVLPDQTIVAVATWSNLRVWISTDQGRTWSKDIPLDITSYGYPGSWILANDESILLPYCASGRTPNRVYLVRFRVNKARNGIELLPVRGDG